jgi:hypothetical protein
MIANLAVVLVVVLFIPAARGFALTLFVSSSPRSSNSSCSSGDPCSLQSACSRLEGSAATAVNFVVFSSVIAPSFALPCASPVAQLGEVNWNSSSGNAGVRVVPLQSPARSLFPSLAAVSFSGLSIDFGSSNLNFSDIPNIDVRFNGCALTASPVAPSLCVAIAIANAALSISRSSLLNVCFDVDRCDVALINSSVAILTVRPVDDYSLEFITASDSRFNASDTKFGPISLSVLRGIDTSCRFVRCLFQDVQLFGINAYAMGRPPQSVHVIASQFVRVGIYGIRVSGHHLVVEQCYFFVCRSA